MASLSGSGSYEFDPLIARGLRLLMSKREESAVELRQLFEEAVAQRASKKGDLKSAAKTYPNLPSKSSTTSTLATTSGKVDGKRVIDRPGGNFNQDPKRAKLEDRSKPVVNKVKLPQISPNNDREEFAMDYVLEKLVGLACEVCKKAEPTQMLECHLCGKTYHQSCHQPNAVGRETYDPRNVWYCNKCKPTPVPSVPGSPMAGKNRQGTPPVAAMASPGKSSRSGQERDKSSKGSSSSHSSKSKKSSSSTDASKSSKSHSHSSSSSSAISASSSSNTHSSKERKKHKEKRKDKKKH